MDRTKAGEVLEVLVNLDFLPTLSKLDDGNYRITVADNEGVLANTLKVFQDNNNVICKARVIDIT